MIKASRRTLIIALVAVIMLWLCLISFKVIYKYSGKSEEIELEYNEDIELEINASISDLFISPARGNSIAIKSERAGGLSTERNGNTITIEQLDRRLLADGYITVEIPSMIKSLKIKTMAGDIDIATIYAESLSIETSSGDIDIINIRSNSAKAIIDKGDINISNSLIGNTLDVSSAIGDITIENITSDKVNAYVDIGDIEVLYSIYSELNASTSTGNIEVNLEEENGTISYKTGTLGDIHIFSDNSYNKSEDTIIIGNGKPRMNLSTTMGRIEVLK